MVIVGADVRILPTEEEGDILPPGSKHSLEEDPDDMQDLYDELLQPTKKSKLEEVLVSPL